METLETDPQMYETSVSESAAQIHGGKKACSSASGKTALLHREIQCCISTLHHTQVGAGA